MKEITHKIVTGLKEIFYKTRTTGNQVKEVFGRNTKRLSSFLKGIFYRIGTTITKLIDEPVEAARIMAVIGLIVAIIGYLFLYVWKQQSHIVQDFYANITAELLSIAITVLIIDRLYAKRAAADEKKRVIQQMASPSNEFALEAVRIARENGWLTSLARINLRNANLQHADLSGAVLYRADLSEGNFANSVFHGSVLVQANLTRAKLEGAYLIETQLQGAILELANLRGVDAPRAQFQGAFLVSANLENAKFYEANFQHASLEKAVLTNAELFTANLENAYLNAAILENAVLLGSNLKGARIWAADLSNADIRGADFQECKLGELIMDNAVYDNKTAWPDDFDPTHFGAINWDELSKEERKNLNLMFSVE